MNLLRKSRKSNWQIARWGKNKIDDLVRHVDNHNMAYQDSKVSQEIALKTIRSKWGTKIADYICQYNSSKRYVKKVKQAYLHLSWKEARKLVIKLVC